MSETQDYELQVLSPSRKKVRPGDIFAMKFDDDFYLHGRVIRVDAFWTPMGEADGLATLVYIYDHVAKAVDDYDSSELALTRLLIPPVMTNNLGWSRGYFSTVENRPLQDADVLERHVFENSDKPDWYFDDRGNEVPSWDGPIGTYGLASYRAIQQFALDALGLKCRRS